MNGTEERVRASIDARWHPRPVPIPPGTARAIRVRRGVRRGASVAVVVSFVGLVVVGANVVGSRGESSSGSTPPPPTWTYDDPSAWPAMVLDPSASPDEELAMPEKAHGAVVTRVIGTVDGIPFALITYDDNHGAVCGEVNTGSIDASRLDFAGPICSAGWFVEIPQGRAMLSTTNLDGSGDRQRQLMFAIVSASTDHVVVTTLDRHRAQLPVFLVDGSDVGFAFVFVPPGSEGAVTAIGSGGDELDSAALCFPEPLIDGPGVSSSCTGTPQGSSDRETAQLSGAR